MELRRDDVLVPRRRERHTVVGLAEGPGFVVQHRVVGVDEVEVGVVRDALEHRVLASQLHRVPAHVRHRHAGGKPRDLARQHAEAVVAPTFLGVVEEGLLAHADAEERLACGDVVEDGLDDSAVAEVVHRVGGGANAGQNEPGSARNPFGIVADEHVGATVDERTFNGARIASAVVDDNDRGSHGDSSVARAFATTGPERVTATAAGVDAFFVYFPLCPTCS